MKYVPACRLLPGLYVGRIARSTDMKGYGMKKALYASLLCFIVIACGTNRDADSPRIFDISSNSGQVKSPITINGEHLTDDYSRTFVRFDGNEADKRDFVSTSSSQIVVRVPNAGRSGPLDIQVSDKTSNSFDFTVIGPWAYVPLSNGQIAAYDTYNNTNRAVFTVDFLPDEIEYTPEGDKAYLINKTQPYVIVLNAPINQFIKTIPLPAPGVDIAVSTLTEHRAFVSHGEYGGVTVIDTIPDTVYTTMQTGPNPGAVALDKDDKDTNRLFVAIRGDNTVQSYTVRELELEGTSTPLSGPPEKLYVSPDNNQAVSINTSVNTIALFEAKGAKLRAELPVGTNPINGVFTDNSSAFYVVNNGSNDVSIINVSEKRVSENVPVGPAPYDVTTRARASDYVYVSNSGNNTVTAIRSDNSNETLTFQVGEDPRDMGSVKGQEEEDDKVFVLNRGSGTMTVIDAENRVVIGSVPVGDGPLYMRTEKLDTFPPNENDIEQYN